MRFKISFVLLSVLAAGVILLNLPKISLANVEILDTDVSGVINQTGSVSDVHGNKNFSFVDEGPHYDTDVNVNALKKQLSNGWEWGMDLRVRKTDDKEVDKRTSVHLLQLTTTLRDKENLFQFGNYYTRFTDITLNRAIQGFNYQSNWEKVGTRLNLVAGRTIRGLDYVQNSRYVWGYHFDQDIIRKKFWFIDKWTVGNGLVHTFDWTDSIGHHTFVPDMKNLVGSINSSIQAIKDLNVNVELAKSLTNDWNNVVQTGATYGYAFTLRSDYRKETRYGQTYLNFDYDHVMPGFQALSGSIVSDREAYYANLSQRFNPQWTANATYRTMRDNLSKTLGTTTRTWSPRFSLNVTPLEKMPDFVLTPYYDIRISRSTNRLVDDQIHLAGVDVTKKVWYGLMLNGGYDLRRVLDGTDLSDEISNEYRFGVKYDWIRDNIRLSPYFNYGYRDDDFLDVANRTSLRSLNWGLTSEFYKRLRVYFNYGLYFDNRSFVNTSSQRNIWDINAEYDILNNLMLVIGWRQYLEDFSAKPSDFTENVGSIRLQYKY